MYIDGQFKDGEIVPTTFIGRVVIAVTLLVLAYILVIMQSQQFNDSLVNEIKLIEKMVGENNTKLIVNRAKNWYRITMHDTYIGELMDYTHKDTKWKGDEIWRTPMVRITNNLKSIWYQACLRLSLALFWMFICLPMIFASLYDGYNARKVKQHQFSVSSTGFFRISYWLIISMFVLSQLYFIIPSAGLIGPTFPLIVTLIISLVGRYVISNLAKVM